TRSKRDWSSDVCSSDLGGHGIHAGAVRDVHVHGEAPAAELLRGAAGGPLVEVGDHHHGALGGEPGGDAPPDAAGGAGDEADAAEIGSASWRGEVWRRES